MAPMSDFEGWLGQALDHDLHLMEVDTDLAQIPFSAEPLPKAIQVQYVAWFYTVFKIEDILAKPHTWDPSIDAPAATQALTQLRNVLCADVGLIFKHLSNHGQTIFTRLGPCAVVQELDMALRVTEVADHLDAYPMNRLRRMIRGYRNALKKTDPCVEDEYDEEVENHLAALSARVNELYLEGQGLDEEIAGIRPGHPSLDAIREVLVVQRQNVQEKENEARETAHFQFQFVHYINARRYGTDLEVISTPMETWEPPGGATPRVRPMDQSSSDEDSEGSLSPLVLNRRGSDDRRDESPTPSGSGGHSAKADYSSAESDQASTSQDSSEPGPPPRPPRPPRPRPALLARPPSLRRERRFHDDSYTDRDDNFF